MHRIRVFRSTSLTAFTALLAGVGCQPNPISTGCPEIYAPVCGADGNTYASECVANQSGVMIAHDGECAPELCLSDADCESGNYCNHDRCLSGCTSRQVCPDVCYGACAPQTGGGCYGDGDCAAGYRCERAAYTPAGSAAGAEYVALPPGMCVPIETGCATDADCGAGYRCELGVAPYSDPPEGAALVAPPLRGMCVPVEPGCFSSADCASGQECVFVDDMPVRDDAEQRIIARRGICQALTRCTSDQECGPGRHCDLSGGVAFAPPDGDARPAPLSGVCRDDARSCADIRCDPGYRCEELSCSPPAPSEPPAADAAPIMCPRAPRCVPDRMACLTDDDCKADEHCEYSGYSPGSEPTTDLIARRGYCEPDVTCDPIDCAIDCVLATDPAGCPICECAAPLVYCLSDDACASEQYCDMTECLSPCRGDMICPAVCYGACRERAVR